MSRILCVAVVVSGALLSWAGPAAAGMNEGVAAVTVGDYPRAISEFEPLAASGNPAAQYQLAKIYLEGRGPVDGLPRGIDLMTKAANGNHPEAQAQLGLMYAMGLGVPVDNTKAYDWLSKAVAALPEGTRRTVAEANRDTVMKRMGASKPAAVAATAKTTETPAATTAKPAATQAASAKPATDATTKTKTSNAASTTAKPATTKPVVTEAAAKPADPKTAAAKPAATVTKPAASATNSAATTTKPASSETTKKPDSATQVASAKAPDAAVNASTAKPTGVRIQLVSMPSEAAAWDAWKQLSGKYSAQLTGLTAMVESADLGTKGTFYRVQTGPFATVAAAQERCAAMKASGLDCLVVGKP
jgi:hypothetical protein